MREELCGFAGSPHGSFNFRGLLALCAEGVWGLLELCMRGVAGEIAGVCGLSAREELREDLVFAEVPQK